MSKQFKQGQSFFDKVIENTGDVNNAFAMALKNNVSLTGTFTKGSEVEPTEVTNTAVAALFNQRNSAATAAIAPQEPTALDYLLPQTFPIQ